MASTVGWSKTSVAGIGRLRPSTAPSRLRSSTAISESSPRSLSGTRSATCAGSRARTCATCSRTASTSIPARRSGLAAANRAARSEPGRATSALRARVAAAATSSKHAGRRPDRVALEEHRPVDRGDADLCVRAVEQPVEDGEPVGGRDHADAAPADELIDAALGGGTDLAPCPPVDAQPGQAAGPAADRQRVEVGVRRGMVGLARRAEHRRDRMRTARSGRAPAHRRAGG